jgi:hypothetical protein
MSQQEDISRVRALHQETLLAKANVVGLGIGFRREGRQKTEELCLIALVRCKVPQAGLDSFDLVPKSVEGVGTDVVQVGDLRAFSVTRAPTSRWRPAPGGVSIGHYQVTAGTLGCIVRDRTTGLQLILSNNHVLANSNAGKAADPILQPGAADGGRADEDTIAFLERFVPLRFLEEPATCRIAQGVAGLGNALARLLGSHHRLDVVRRDAAAVNVIDAALARPVDASRIDPQIVGIGQIQGTRAAELGMAVRKSGRSTGLTTGEVEVVEATVTISYGDRQARFEGQTMSGAMSAAGDSGSVLVAANGPQAVGLLFAGSDQATIYNPIEQVLQRLEVVL